jgi:hypothetical protein
VERHLGAVEIVVFEGGFQRVGIVVAGDTDETRDLLLAQLVKAEAAASFLVLPATPERAAVSRNLRLEIRMVYLSALMVAPGWVAAAANPVRLLRFY